MNEDQLIELFKNFPNASIKEYGDKYYLEHLSPPGAVFLDSSKKKQLLKKAPIIKTWHYQT